MLEGALRTRFSGHIRSRREARTLGECLRVGVGIPRGPGALRVASISPEIGSKWVLGSAKLPKERTRFVASNFARVNFSPFSGGSTGPKRVGALGGCPEARVDAPKGLRALRVASKAPEKTTKWVFCCAKHAENRFVQVATNFTRTVFSPITGENTGPKGVGVLGGRPRVKVDAPRGPLALRVAFEAPEGVEKWVSGCVKQSENPIVLATANFSRKFTQSMFSPFRSGGECPRDPRGPKRGRPNPNLGW